MADNETEGQNPSDTTSSATVASDDNDNGNQQQRSTTVSRSKENLEDDNSSPSKKPRLEVEKEDYNLEERLNNILRCSRCQDLPNPTVYQCANGHLLCVGCLLELSAESRVLNTQAACPQCDCAVSLRQCTRNLVIEKTVAELPIACPFCQKLISRHELFNHKTEQCLKRPVQCKYSSVGCDWVGEFRSVGAHEAFCPSQTKMGRDLIDSVRRMDEMKDREMRMYKRLLELLSCEKVELIDFKLQPYHSEFGQNDLWYESRTFAAHDLSWMVHACVRCRQDPMTGSVTRCLGYKLMLRSKPPVRFQMSYMLVKGPGGMVVMDPMLYDFRFSEDDMETPFRDAPCQDPSDVSALLAAKSIHLRLALMQVKK